MGVKRRSDTGRDPATPCLSTSTNRRTTLGLNQAVKMPTWTRSEGVAFGSCPIPSVTGQHCHWLFRGYCATGNLGLRGDILAACRDDLAE